LSFRFSFAPRLQSQLLLARTPLKIIVLSSQLVKNALPRFIVDGAPRQLFFKMDPQASDVPASIHNLPTNHLNASGGTKPEHATHGLVIQISNNASRIPAAKAPHVPNVTQRAKSNPKCLRAMRPHIRAMRRHPVAEAPRRRATSPALPNRTSATNRRTPVSSQLVASPSMCAMQHARSSLCPQHCKASGVAFRSTKGTPKASGKCRSKTHPSSSRCPTVRSPRALSPQSGLQAYCSTSPALAL